jgi:threonyl-tRNA synthetase
MELDHQLTVEDLGRISGQMTKLPTEDIHFKLFNPSGLYLWRDPEGKQIQRLHGTAWPTREELRRDLARHDGAAERDHRRIGRDLKLFEVLPESPGAFFWLPRGALVLSTLAQKTRELLLKDGYTEAGGDPTLLHEKKVPRHRELPLRLFDPRSRSSEGFGADSLLVLRPDQLEGEIHRVLGLTRRVHGTFGIELRASLSIADGDSRKKWLAGALERDGMAYGVEAISTPSSSPRIDFISRNVFGVFEHHAAAIELDPDLPERLDLRYVDADERDRRSIAVRHALFDSPGRFLQAILERTAGRFPVWLAPVQGKVLTLSRRFRAYGRKVHERLLAAGIRSELDDRDEEIAFKLRAAAPEKVPYLLIVGAKEEDGGTVSVRARERPEVEAVLLVETFVRQVAQEAQGGF